MVKKNGYKSIDLNDENTNLKKNIVITFDDGYKDILINALPLLKKYNFKAICYVVSDLVGKENIWDLNKKKFLKKELMSKNDIIEWISEGMTIGSHSHNHVNLCDLNLSQINEELKNSKYELENITGIKIKSFSYPYGKVNSTVYDNVKSFFNNAVTTNRSRYKPKQHDKYLIPRIDMGKKLSNFKLFLKLSTIYEDIKFNDKQLYL